MSTDFTWRNPAEKPRGDGRYNVLIQMPLGRHTSKRWFEGEFEKVHQNEMVIGWCEDEALASLPVAEAPKQRTCEKCGEVETENNPIRIDPRGRIVCCYMDECRDRIGVQLSAAVAQADMAVARRDIEERQKFAALRERDEARAELKKIVEAGWVWWDVRRGHCLQDDIRLYEALRPHMHPQEVE